MKNYRLLTIAVVIALLLSGVRSAFAASGPTENDTATSLTANGWRDGEDCTGTIVQINEQGNGLAHVGFDCGVWKWNGHKWVLVRSDVSAGNGGLPTQAFDIIVPNTTGVAPDWTPNDLITSGEGDAKKVSVCAVPGGDITKAHVIEVNIHSLGGHIRDNKSDFVMTADAVCGETVTELPVTNNVTVTGSTLPAVTNNVTVTGSTLPAVTNNVTVTDSALPAVTVVSDLNPSQYADANNISVSDAAQLLNPTTNDTEKKVDEKKVCLNPNGKEIPCPNN